MPSLRPDALDPLVCADGTPVADAATWWQRRAPELRAAFQDEVYGRLPAPVPVRWQEEAAADDLVDGAVRYRGLRIVLELPAGASHELHLALFLPADASDPPPVIVAPNRSGNPGLIDHPAIAAGAPAWNPHQAEPLSVERGQQAKGWPIADICARGYALATWGCNDAEPDHPAVETGLRRKLGTFDQHHWGTIACWAWANMRVLDALETCPLVDAGRAAVTGMSRRGKAALVTGAFDPRFHLVIPHQSGTVGMALSRHEPEESVERICATCPHWFAPRLATWGDDPRRLPLDQHLLVALCAPRAVLDLAGDQDTWASPALATEALRLAAPVWRLLGADDRVGVYRDHLPADDLSRLLQLWRDAPHQLDREFWRGYLDAADAHLR